MPAARALLVASFAVGLSATPAMADVAWRAPASCPDAASVHARIDARLGAMPDAHALASLGGIEVDVTRTPQGFVATIDARALTVANAVRTLKSTRCDALADAVALIVVRLANEARDVRVVPTAADNALASVDTVARADRDDPPALGAPAATAVVVARAPAPPRHEPAWGGGIHLHGLSGIGAQPRVGIGGEVGVIVRRRDLMVQLAHARWIPRTDVLVEGAPGGFAVALATYSLRIGWGPERMPIRGWLLAEVGQLSGRGIALFDNRMGDTRWSAIGVGFGVGWPISDHVRLVGTFELAAPFDRARFLVGASEVHRPAAALARSALGLEVGWR